MKLPFRSIETLSKEAISTARRFPLVLASSFAAGIVAFLLTEYSDKHDDLYRLMTSLCLGISAMTVGRLAWENERWPKGARYGIFALLIGALCGLYVWLSYMPDALRIARTLQFALAVHLLVAFVCFVNRESDIDFWRFNERLFLRFLQAALFSGVLYLGIAACLETTRRLFDIEFPRHMYERLFHVLAFGFNTWFFLAGVPKRDFAARETADYPVVLKVFTQYVLIPLVAIYLVILYAYVGRILILWEWPKGTVGWLVTIASLVGIFSLLLVYPFQFMEGNGWIRRYSKGFYVALIPLIAMLFVATTRRISDYGITEPRYFLWLLACWVAGISLYFILSRKKSIKTIPISLFVLTVLSSFGPWGAYSVSMKSQTTRFLTLLKEKNLFDGKTFKKLESNDILAGELGNMLRYLENHHGATAVKTMGIGTINEIRTALNVTDGYYNFPNAQRFSFYTNDEKKWEDIRGYDSLARLEIWSSRGEQKFEGIKTTAKVVGSSIELIHDDGRKLTISLEPLVKELIAIEKGKTPRREAIRTYKMKSGGSEATLHLKTLDGTFLDGKTTFYSLYADILLKWR